MGTSNIDAKNDYQKLLAVPGVFGVMIINTEGLAIRSNLNHEDTLKYSGQIAPLVEKSRKFMKELAVNDENQTLASTSRGGAGVAHSHRHQSGGGSGQEGLSVIRIRSLQYEILVCPCVEGSDYIMIALQKAVQQDQHDAELE